MRNSIRLIVAATVLLAVPAAAQTENEATATTLTNTSDAAATGAGTTNNLDSDAAVATGTTNGLTTGPGAPVTTDPAAADMSSTESSDEGNDNRFPWGLLGLLGLAGLLGRKRDRAGTDRR